jgi:SAM-dependent methyltransferase
MTRLNRQWLTLRLIDSLHVERFFEAGFGAGDLLIALAERGMRGRGIELSDAVVEACRRRIETRGLSDRLEVERADLLSIPEEAAYDLAIAFEVLEHIEDDRAALAVLRRMLRPGGHLLLSVPAHMKLWGASDVWAGHVRRYERADLLEELDAGGFAVRRFLSLGFPLMRASRGIRNLIYRGDVRPGEAAERTMASGVERPPLGRRLRFLIPAISWLDHQLQRPFVGTDLGEEYFVLARRDGA